MLHVVWKIITIIIDIIIISLITNLNIWSFHGDEDLCSSVLGCDTV
jgi:hypothetical protein